VSESLRFDRAVEYYDRTRAMSEGALREQTALLAAEIRDRGRCLEIGVGTGIVALPLAEAGVRLVGLDLSAPMLIRLVENAGGTVPFPLVVGDATAMPLADGTFGTSLIRHVLHLIPEWERAIAELVRVVDRPGAVLVSTGDIPPVWREVTARFVERVGRASFARGLDVRDVERLDAAFARFGGVPRTLPAIPERMGVSLETFLDQMGEGLHSWTWDVPEDERRAATEETRRWALDRFGGLDPPGARDVTIEWRAYDLA
jgi:SAM-dependent methyltransferase